MSNETMTAELEPIDDRRELVVPGNRDETLQFCVEHWIDVAQSAIKERGKFTVALSGGSTPKAIFEMLSSEKYRDEIDWESVYLFWGDERSVGPEDPDSNYKMAMDAGFSMLPLNRDHIFRMEGEKGLDASCEKYESLLKEHLDQESFDLIMLGMGNDGHTASLFPGTEALGVNDRLVVKNFVPKLGSWRMTFTYKLINQASNISFYVLGEDKANMLAEVLKGDERPLELPSQKVGTPEHKALWIADHNAAEKL